MEDIIVPNSLATGKTYDWMDIVTRTGKSQNYELKISGGNEKSKHYISAGYTDDEGVFYGVDYQKYQLRANIDQKVNNWLICRCSHQRSLYVNQ